MIGDKFEIEETEYQQYSIRISIDGSYHHYDYLNEHQKNNFLQYYLIYIEERKRGFYVMWD